MATSKNHKSQNRQALQNNQEWNMLTKCKGKGISRQTFIALISENRFKRKQMEKFKCDYVVKAAIEQNIR